MNTVCPVRSSFKFKIERINYDLKCWFLKSYSNFYVEILTWNLLNSWRVHLTSPSLVTRLFFIKHLRTDFLLRKCFKCGSCKGLYSPGLYSVKKGSDKSKSIVIPGTSWNRFGSWLMQYFAGHMTEHLTAKLTYIPAITSSWHYENLFSGSCSVITSLGMSMNGCGR